MLSKDEIEHVMGEFRTNKASRAAQRALAHEVTKLVHGEQVVSDVLEVTQLLFTGLPLDEAAFTKIKSTFSATPLSSDSPLFDVLIALGLAKSNTEARRFVSEGAITINNDKVTLEKTAISADDFHDGILVARRGKNAVAVASQE